MPTSAETSIPNVSSAPFWVSASVHIEIQLDSGPITSEKSVYNLRVCVFSPSLSLYRFPVACLLNVLLVCVIIGNVDKGVVEVTNCFCVPHKEHDDQVEAELSYALDVYELNRRVNSSEVIVGK